MALVFECVYEGVDDIWSILLLPTLGLIGPSPKYKLIDLYCELNDVRLITRLPEVATNDLACIYGAVKRISAGIREPDPKEMMPYVDEEDFEEDEMGGFLALLGNVEHLTVQRYCSEYCLAEMKMWCKKLKHLVIGQSAPHTSLFKRLSGPVCLHDLTLGVDSIHLDSFSCSADILAWKARGHAGQNLHPSVILEIHSGDRREAKSLSTRCHAITPVTRASSA